VQDSSESAGGDLFEA